MLNQVVIVGRVVKTIFINKITKNKEIQLSVPRSFKNDKGEFVVDLIDCVLTKELAKNAKKFCKKGELLGIKGRIQKEEDSKQVVFVEKLTFLSNGKEEK